MNHIFIIPTIIGPILSSQFFVVAITLGALVGLLIIGALPILCLTKPLIALMACKLADNHLILQWSIQNFPLSQKNLPLFQQP